MDDLELIRGDRKTLALSDLVDGDGSSASFAADDVVRWTAKRYAGQPDSAALFSKTSAVDGGIVADVGSDTATISIIGSDWDGLDIRNDVRFVWDLQIALGGDEDQVVTLATGEGTILADVTVAAP